MTEVYNTD